MKPNDKSCRNCGQSEFFTREVDAKGGMGPNLMPIGLFLTGEFQLRVCGGCGLVEWFVPARFLATVKEKFFREE